MIECLTVQVLQCIAQQPVEQYTIRQRGGGGRLSLWVLERFSTN